jgi:hypothetical protein
MGVAAGVVRLEADEPRAASMRPWRSRAGTPCTRSPSAMLSPIVARGRAMRTGPGTRSASWPAPAQLRARRGQQVLAVVADRARIGSRRRSSKRPSVLLPHPDSPTSRAPRRPAHVEIDVGHGVTGPLARPSARCGSGTSSPARASSSGPRPRRVAAAACHGAPRGGRRSPPHRYRPVASAASLCRKQRTL